MKKYLVFAAAAALFAACSSDDGAITSEKQEKAQNVEQAVEFSAYVNRGTTRAGQTGNLTDAQMKLATGGFGIFAYYTDGEPYSENAKPNFMYNQKVSWNESKWEYTPIKYWPNEFGTNAESDGVDKLTFFAYAPYAEVETSTGIVKSGTGIDVTTGIVALTRNTAHGDPFVKYYASMDPAKRVDLCFGVAKAAFSGTVTTGTANAIDAGEPYIDVTKPGITDKINFDFKHALASLNVQIDADVDVTTHDDVAYPDAKTKIYVRSVTFEGFTNKGMLNLNSEGKDGYKPNWYDLTGVNTIGSGSVTIYDGRRDGREGQANSGASNEVPNELNENIIQTSSATAGVPATTAVNLFKSATATEPIFVIPTNQPLKVTIVYDVETEDSNLPTYLSDGTTKGSSIENKITKSITTGGSTDLVLAAGKAYTVNLHLGMTTVKFEASVSDWVTGPTADPTWTPVN